MTRDDIIRIAREAGIVVTGEAVWKLCELVAAAERDACVQVCKDVEQEADIQVEKTGSKIHWQRGFAAATCYVRILARSDDVLER